MLFKLYYNLFVFYSKILKMQENDDEIIGEEQEGKYELLLSYFIIEVIPKLRKKGNKFC